MQSGAIEMHNQLKTEFSTIVESPFKSKTAAKSAHLLEQFDSMTKVIAGMENMKRNFSLAFDALPFQQRGFCDETYAETIAGLINGDKTKGGAATALAKQIERLGFETKAKARIASPVGGRPCVPAMLSGSPMAMRRRVMKPKETAPLTIVVNVNSSGGIDQKSLEKRGIAIAALVQKLAIARPVTLHICGTLMTSQQPTYIALIKFPTAPLDMARLAYAIANQGLARGVLFGMAAHAGAKLNQLEGRTDHKTNSTSSHVQWPFGSVSYIDKRAKAGEVTNTISTDLAAYFKTDIFYVPGAFLNSADHIAIMGDAIGWINSRMKEFSEHI
jgi:hypothetical protein